MLLEMVWRDQEPPTTDVLLEFTVPFSGDGTPAYLEIDKLPEGLFRAPPRRPGIAPPLTVARRPDNCDPGRG